jgi:hypothetical protein
MVYVQSQVDKKYYLVKDTKEKQTVANLLAQLCERINTLNNYLYLNQDKFPDYKEYIERLHDKIKDCDIIENGNDKEYTSYSVNKGEQLVFCVRSRKTHDLHDINLMMYVTLHELSHIACPIYDNHGPLFKRIFIFLTEQAINLNLYTKLDFSQNPTEYCGLMIADSIV